MNLHHYRPIESALLEIGKGAPYFANKVSAPPKLHFPIAKHIKSLYVKRNNKLLRATHRIYCYSVYS